MMASGSVLVVDDEPTILSTLKTALTLEGYHVDAVGGVGLAERRLQEGTYDIVLLDVALPDGDGVELLGRLRANDNPVSVIMMSGHATIDTAVRATQLGALDFLEKPLSTDRLLLVVENALRLARAEEQARALKVEAGYFDDLIGSGPAMREFGKRLGRAARSNVSVLLTGERGTGKELAARAIHRLSPRASQTMEKLNCAAIPAELFESELFGHVTGAFTGATRSRKGKFERADGGTLFLDEVGDMPLGMQAKLLRVLQEKEIERVGGSETIKVDVRIVAATNRDLTRAAQQGEFRPDLFDRLNVLPLHLPPLRARREDIAELAHHFIDAARHSHGRPDVSLTPGAVQALKEYTYPGNVRELGNLIERLVILSPDDVIAEQEVRSALGMGAYPVTQGLYRAGVPYRVLVEEAERTVIVEALAAHSGQMAATARALGLERSHLYKKARALGIRRTEPSGDE